MRLDLPTLYSYIDARGKNGCSVQINRELRYHGSQHGPVLGTKRDCGPEDKLATFLGIFSIITLILGLLNPLTPKEAYSTVKEARDQLQENKAPVNNETTTTAAGIVILVFLFLMLGIACLHTVYLLVKGQWWQIQELCSKSKEETDEDIIKQEENTILEILMTVKRERDKIKEKLASKHGGSGSDDRNQGKVHSRRSYIKVTSDDQEDGDNI